MNDKYITDSNERTIDFKDAIKPRRDTIYKYGNKTYNTDVKDLYKIYNNPLVELDIKQIGYYTNGNKEIVIPSMPRQISSSNSNFDLPKIVTSLENLFIHTNFKNKTHEKEVWTTIRYWDTSNITNMKKTFNGTQFSIYNEGNLNLSWNTSNVTDMSYMFMGSDFNAKGFGTYPNKLNFNTKNVQTMRGIFQNNHKFDMDIGNWDTKNVKDMSNMFSDVTKFNQDISDWNTINVKNMNNMFEKAGSFNQDLSEWKVDNVTTHLNFDKGANKKWKSECKPKFHN